MTRLEEIRERWGSVKEWDFTRCLDPTIVVKRNTDIKVARATTPTMGRTIANAPRDIKHLLSLLDEATALLVDTVAYGADHSKIGPFLDKLEAE